MMETTISGLIIAAVGGFAWIAYHHHDGFSRITRFFRWASLIALAIFSVFRFGAYYSAIKMLPATGIADSLWAWSGLHELERGFWWLAGSCICLGLYLCFLEFLPTILRKADQNIAS
ncbi:MAG: hypothetical protein WBO10_05370 [Pyrinomonadaceae bacterium]